MVKKSRLLEFLSESPMLLSMLHERYVMEVAPNTGMDSVRAALQELEVAGKVEQVSREHLGEGERRIDEVTGVQYSIPAVLWRRVSED